MKTQKSLILAYIITCIIAIGGGLAFGFRKVDSEVTMSWDELASLIHDKDAAKNRIEKISFVSATFPEPTCPKLEVELKNPHVKAVLILPRLKQVEWVLEQSAAHGIDFDEVFWSSIDGSRFRRSTALIRSGRRTRNYQNPPDYALYKGLPADYIEPFRAKHADLMKSLGLDSPI